VLDWRGYSGGTSIDPGADAAGSEAAPAADAAEDAARDATQDVAPDTAADGGTDGGFDSGKPDATTLACGPMTCGGCCQANGFCAGGESAATCGVSGAACVDCSSTGLTCSAGECTADGGAVEGGVATTCDVPTCGRTIPCFPGTQLSCCRGDGTCGCSNINYAMLNVPGPCM
jgi:hypothetical protein